MKILLASLLLLVVAQAFCPDLVEQLNNSPNIDQLDDLKQRHAIVTHKTDAWMNYALNQALNPSCPGYVLRFHPETNYGIELANCLATTILQYVDMESRLAVQRKSIMFSTKTCTVDVTVQGNNPLQFNCAAQFGTGTLCENTPMDGTAKFNVTCQVGGVVFRVSLY